MITPGKGSELLNAINTANCNYHSGGDPTYWPIDNNKIPDLLDFFTLKGVPVNKIKIEILCELTSDHTLVLLTLSASVIKKRKKHY